MQTKRILFINFGGLGDEILFLPTIQSIKKEFSEADITLALEERSKGISFLTDVINHTLIANIKGKRKYIELIKLLIQIWCKKYDVVISSGSNKFISIFLFLTFIKEKYGYNTGKLSEILLTKTVDLNKNQYAVNMYHDLAKPITNIETQLPELSIQKKPLIENSVIIHPGVSKISVQKGMIKTIPAEEWAKVVEMLADSGKNVFLVGGPDDKECIDIITKLVPSEKFKNLFGFLFFCMKNRFFVFIVLSCCIFFSCASAKKEKSKNYVGWIEPDNSKIDVSLGCLRMSFRPKIGSFNIFVIDEDNKEQSVFSTHNEFSASSFYLKCGKEIYKLNSASGLKTETGAVVKYTISNIAKVSVFFDFMKSDEQNDYDMIKISAEIENLGTRQKKYALKGVFDTVLGEKDLNHFFSSTNDAINTEKEFRNVKAERWFVSKNDKYSMQFLLDGVDITPIECVLLGNKTTFDSNAWIPTLSIDKSFDSFVSYNDSEVCIVWPEVEINPNEKENIIFYLAFAANGEKPQGNYFIGDKIEVVEVKKEKPVVKKEVVKVPEEEKVKETKKEIPDVKFDVATLSREKLSQEYVAGLMERIANLEDSGENVDREELLMLNAELDAILEILRQ